MEGRARGKAGVDGAGDMEWGQQPKELMMTAIALLHKMAVEGGRLRAWQDMLRAHHAGVR